jgi:hypothetical protein
MAMSDKRAFVDAVRNKYAPSMPPIDRERYTDIKGLEGPFMLRSGKVVYYDPKEGKYYDRDRDMYMSDEEHHQHSNPRESVDFSRFAEILEENARLALEYEMHVDGDGYAYDDEGNREYVGKRFRGTYRPSSFRQMRDMGLPTPADAMETLPKAPVDQNKVEALQKALAIRPNDFLSSILAQVKDGRALTEAQKKAVRQNFYKLRMKEDADLFR